MVANKDDVLKLAMQLSEADRLELSDRLAMSVSDRQEVSEAWLAELHDRYAAYQRGEIQTVDGESVFRELRGS